MTSKIYRLGPEKSKQFEDLISEDKAFARWMRKFSNEVSKYNYFRWFVPLCDHLSRGPQQLLDEYKKGGEVRDALLDQIEAHLNELKERSVVSAMNLHAALCSFLMHNGAIPGATAFEIPTPKRETIPSQYIPTEEEFESILRFAPKIRDKFLLAFLRYSGARLGVLEDPEAPTMRLVLDLDMNALEAGRVAFKSQSSCGLMIYAAFEGEEVVRTRDTYVTSLPPRGMQILSEYLEDRMRHGEKLTPDSFLFKSESCRKIPYLDKRAATLMISRTSKAAGFLRKEGKAKFSAHSLRRLFYNSLSGIDDVDREALMGHVKGVRARYYGSVDELKKAVEFMRQKYELGMRRVMGLTDEETRVNALYDFAKTMGISDEKIEKIKRSISMAANTDQLNMLRRTLYTELHPGALAMSEKAPGSNGVNGFSSKIVTEEELLCFLDDGWELVQQLANGKLLLRKPVQVTVKID
jgi:integrase